MSGKPFLLLMAPRLPYSMEINLSPEKYRLLRPSSLSRQQICIIIFHKWYNEAVILRYATSAKISVVSVSHT